MLFKKTTSILNSLDYIYLMPAGPRRCYRILCANSKISKHYAICWF
jgi:hypothetical protein